MSAPYETDPLQNESYEFAARLALATLVVCFLLFLTACSSISYTQDTAPHMLIVGADVPFYINGPAQGNGPDRKLSEGDEARVLRREFGYSFVQLSDGKKGYVANESLVTAPPEPSPTPPHKVSDEDTNTTFEPPGFRY